MSDSLWQVLDYLRQGGWIMIPLGLVSLVMWLLIIERQVVYRSLHKSDISIAKAMAVLKGERIQLYSTGIRVQLVRNFMAARSGDPDLDVKILHQCNMCQHAGLRRSLAVIAVLAGVAPLLGLLGTVLGMIETFNVISIFGTGNAKAMAGGISVALITTQTGLIIAIPGLFLSGLLERQAKRMETRLEEITNILERFIKRPSLMEGMAA